MFKNNSNVDHCRESHVGRIVSLTIAGLFMACFFALAFGWLVMILWNWLMPGIFGIKAVTYWQAFGLILLGKLIFGGLSGHPKSFHDKFRYKMLHPAFKDWCTKDDWAPAGAHRNWIYYRKYWKERGRQDFEDYLKETGVKVDKDERDKE